MAAQYAMFTQFPSDIRNTAQREDYLLAQAPDYDVIRLFRVIPDNSYRLNEALVKRYSVANQLVKGESVRMVSDAGGRPRTAILYKPLGYVPRGVNEMSHWLNKSNMGRHALGIGRLNMAFHIMSYWSMWDLWSTTAWFGIRMTFVNIDHLKNEENINFSSAFGNRHYGTEDPSASALKPIRTNRVVNVFPPFAAHDPLIGGNVVGAHVVDTNVGNFTGKQPHEILALLRKWALEKMPDNATSPPPTGETQVYKLVGVFLIQARPNRTGGVFDVPSTHSLVRPREETGEVVPQRPIKKYRGTKAMFWASSNAGSKLCFWECLAVFLKWRREKGASVPECRGRDLPLLDRYCRPHVRDSVAGKSMAKTLMEYFSASCEISEEDLAPFSLEWLGEVEAFFGVESIVVVDASNDVLYPLTMINVMDPLSMVAEQNKLLMCLDDGHFGVIKSYTGFVASFQCHICGVRYKRADNFREHLEKRSCLTCECLKLGAAPARDVFDTEEEYWHHRTNAATQCPLYVSTTVTGTETVIRASVTPKQRLRNRFPHDVDHALSKRPYLREPMMTSTLKPWCNEEAVYFDLESVVPRNQENCARSELSWQQPYAAAWISRTLYEKREPICMVYGDDCVEEFFKWCDIMYDSYFETECKLWEDRARASVETNPEPVTGRQMNFSGRVQRTWENYYDKVVKDDPTMVCPGVCGNSGFESREEWLTHLHDGGFNMYSDCAYHHYGRRAALKNFSTNFNRGAPRVYIYAHNGGRYDWLFLHRFMMEQGRLSQLDVTFSNGKYYRMVYRNIFVFRDTMLFLCGSLDRLGKDFRVDTLKQVFPYDFVDSMEKTRAVIRGETNVRAMLPRSMFKTSEVVKGEMKISRSRPFTENEYVEFFESRDWVYDVEAETRTYLEADVYCLMEIWEKFMLGWRDMPHSPNLLEYDTIGQLSHSYFLKHYVGMRQYAVFDVPEKLFFERAVFGGRTEVFRRWVDPDEAGPMHYVDVNSLYPYVMEARSLPGGDPTWNISDRSHLVKDLYLSEYRPHFVVRDAQYFAGLCSNLNQCAAVEVSSNLVDSIYGYLEVDVTCPYGLDIPVLPERRKMGAVEKNVFCLRAKKKQVYYSEELKYAIRMGYRVTAVYCYVAFHRVDVYSDLIRLLRVQKLLGEGKDEHGVPIPDQGKNTSLRTAAKLASNSLYGKTLQNLKETTYIIHSNEEMWKLMQNAGDSIGITPIYRSSVSDVCQVRVRRDKEEVQKKSCVPMGAAILAEARMVLYDFMKEAQDAGLEVCYCDTDSLVLMGEGGLPSHCLHDSEYGKMKVEIESEKIAPGGFVGIAPKCYAFQMVDNLPYARCKGVNLSSNLKVMDHAQFEDPMSALDLLCTEAIEEELEENVEVEEGVAIRCGLSFENMWKLVRGEIDAMRMSQMQFFKSDDKRIAACNISKEIRNSFDKRIVVSGGRTIPFSDIAEKWVRMCKRSERGGYVGGVEDHRVFLDMMRKLPASHSIPLMCEIGGEGNRLVRQWYSEFLEGRYGSEFDAFYLHQVLDDDKRLALKSAIFLMV